MNNRIIISILLCLLAAPSTFAQWRIGGKVGINWSKITGLEVARTERKLLVGYNIGFVGNYAFHDRFDLQGELLYTRRGGKEEIANLSDNPNEQGDAVFTNTRTLSHYIDIPISVHFYPFRREENICIHAGIQPGLSVGETLKSDGDLPKTSLYGARRKFDFGLIFGATYHFPQETFLKNCFLEGRYLLGLTDHYKAYPGKMRNRSIQLSFGYLFSVR